MDDPDRLVPRNSVIADRDVDVPHAQAPGPLDVRPAPIDGDDGPDPDPLQGGAAVSTLGLAAAGTIATACAPFPSGSRAGARSPGVRPPGPGARRGRPRGDRARSPCSLDPGRDGWPSSRPGSPLAVRRNR